MGKLIDLIKKKGFQVKHTIEFLTPKQRRRKNRRSGLPKYTPCNKCKGTGFQGGIRGIGPMCLICLGTGEENRR